MLDSGSEVDGWRRWEVRRTRQTALEAPPSEHMVGSEECGINIHDTILRTYRRPPDIVKKPQKSKLRPT